VALSAAASQDDGVAGSERVGPKHQRETAVAGVDGSLSASMCHDRVVTPDQEPSAMTITTMGLDTAKSAFQIHGVDENGKAVLKRKLHRHELAAFFERQPRCTVFLEACGASHHWGRLLTGLGHEVKLIAAEAVRPFVKRGRKNDAADAAALCVAGAQPEMRFVPIKSEAQQAVLALHAARSLLVKQQTMTANAIRGLASEFGLVVPQGLRRLEELMTQVTAEAGMPAEGQQALALLHAQLQATAERIATIERRSPASGRSWPRCSPPRWAATSAPSRAPGTSPPGSGSCRGSTPLAARCGWVGSPRRATPRSASCW
jgi:hypothetical protein